MSRPETFVYDGDSHYEAIAAFWRGHGVEPWPRRVMSERGVVAYIDGKLAGSAHYHVTNSGNAVVAPVVVDPNLSERRQASVAAQLIEAVTAAAKADCPTGFLLALAHQESVLNLFVNRAGFRGTGSIMTASLVVPPEGFSVDIIEEK